MNKIFALSLVLRTEEDMDPGWYILGTAEDELQGAKIPARKVSSAQAEEIGRAFESVFSPSDQLEIHPFEIVRSGSVTAIKAVEAELLKAEAAANRVEDLQRIFNELSK